MSNSAENFKYYAFISYSRKNSKAAGYLHKQLEHFRIPVKYVAKENLPPHKKFLRPIFRDRRDLEAGNQSFANDIKCAVERSRYLIVLCSPESASSYWVNEEIKYFLSSHGNDFDLIVPVILSGTPGSGDGSECLPELLRSKEILSRNLPSMIPDDDESEKSGWEYGVIQAMSFMLKIQREKIKSSVDAEKIRMAKFIAAAGIVVSIIFTFLAVWAVRAERMAAANAALAIKNANEAKENAAKAKEQADIAEQAKKLAIANEQKANENAAKAKEQADIAEQAKKLAIANEQKANENAALAIKNANEAKANEAKAKEQAAITREAIDFLTGMFQSVDPYEKGKTDLKVIDAIRAKIPEIKKIEKWQLKARIAKDVGNLLCSVAEYKQATDLLQIALQLNLQHRADSMDTAATYNNIAMVHHKQGKYQEALEYSKKALQVQLKATEENHPVVATIYNNMGITLFSKGKYDEALEYYHKSLNIRLKVLEENHQDFVQSYSNLGLLYAKCGNYKDAEAHLKKALAIQLIISKENQQDIAKYCALIGAVIGEQEKYAEAELYMQKAVDIFKITLGEDALQTKECMKVLDEIRAKLKK